MLMEFAFLSNSQHNSKKGIVTPKDNAPNYNINLVWHKHYNQSLGVCKEILHYKGKKVLGDCIKLGQDGIGGDLLGAEVERWTI